MFLFLSPDALNLKNVHSRSKRYLRNSSKNPLSTIIIITLNVDLDIALRLLPVHMNSTAQ